MGNAPDDDDTPWVMGSEVSSCPCWNNIHDLVKWDDDVGLSRKATSAKLEAVSTKQSPLLSVELKYQSEPVLEGPGQLTMTGFEQMA